MPVTRRPEWRDYDEATRDLAATLHRVWHACEAAGANLPEALSYALALAARDLVAELAMDDLLGATDDEVDQELAVGVLVAQRPGSWEAALLRDLTFPVDLLPASEGPRPA